MQSDQESGEERTAISTRPANRLNLKGARRTGIGVAVGAAGRWGWCGDVQVEASVRSPAVVVSHVRVQDLL
jgi:hypothetical protein